MNGDFPPSREALQFLGMDWIEDENLPPGTVYVMTPQPRDDQRSLVEWLKAHCAVITNIGEPQENPKG